MASITRASPQFLVEDLQKSLAFYVDRLGFNRDFTYEGFYGSVSRDGATLHLKCAPKLDAERLHRRSGNHLDAYLSVLNVEELHAEFRSRGAPIALDLGRRPWGLLDFHVEDLDGYILCFSEEST
jgi:catechol 2,3-dioxygenase-like lactoylglutathione lyase family enzyme